MKRFGRVLAVLVCAVVLLTLFVSSACCAHRAGHGCAGEDCRLCRLAVLAGQSASFVALLLSGRLFAFCTRA